MYYTYQSDGTYAPTSGVAPSDVSASLDGIHSVLSELQKHKAADEVRFSALERMLHDSPVHSEPIHSPKEKEMSHAKEVNVYTNPMGGCHGGDTATIAALMNNRAVGPVGGDGLFGGGFGGGGLVGGLVLGALLRNGNGGIFGGGSDGAGCAQFAFDQSLVNGITGLTAAVPTTALETQNAILSAIAAQTIGVQQGLSNVKDTVQNVGALNLSATNQVNQNVLTTGLQTQIAIHNDGDKTRALINQIDRENLNRQLTVAQNALLEDRFLNRSREVEVNVAQTVNTNQQQGQLQTQLQAQAQAITNIGHCLHNVLGDLQTVKQGQVIFNSGTMAASGTQAAANTKVA